MKKHLVITQISLITAFLLLASLHGSLVYAASQGGLQSTSTGTLNFNVTKPARADITGLSDLNLARWLIGDGPVQLTEDVCVYSTRPSGGYSVLATGSGTNNAFGLSNGSYTMMYSVAWNAGGVGNLANTGVTLTTNTTTTGLTNAATDSSSCSGSRPGPTARLIVNISEAELTAAPSGTFLGILTLTITPN